MTEIAEFERIGRDNRWFPQADYLSRIPKERLSDILKDNPIITERLMSLYIMDIDRGGVGNRIRKQISYLIKHDPLILLNTIAMSPNTIDGQKSIQKIVKSVFKRNPHLVKYFFVTYPNIQSIFMNRIYNKYIGEKQDIYLGTRGLIHTTGSYVPDEVARRIANFHFKSRRKIRRNSRGKSRRKIRRKSRGKSRRKSRRKSRGKSRRKSRRKSRGKSRRKSRRKSRGKSRRKIRRKSRRKSRGKSRRGSKNNLHRSR